MMETHQGLHLLLSEPGDCRFFQTRVNAAIGYSKVGSLAADTSTLDDVMVINHIGHLMSLTSERETVDVVKKYIQLTFQYLVKQF
jgi:hypothetical protein